ncbi:conserved exported hypothetical protein [Microcystis aeruginosa PCC 9807]|uniref:CHAT domain-containing protein n=1 Tax=Microcystis aeruginosa PCC 9807 TaxID=1160283 RepID=I4HAU1_MICAE|nr:tetratricopeptide repeat protein [Microcystis aeruginosa]CCI19165.1 conserved exported hypothetical protein [Microcystis aeruginosa PCC 9807]
MLKSLNLATLLLLLASGVSILPISQPGIVPPVQAQTNETKKAEAERLFNEGMQLVQQGTAESYQQAITKWEQALPLWRNLGDKAQEALINLQLGRVYSRLGFKPKALEYYNQALPLYQSLKDRTGEAVTLSNIGAVYDALGEKQKALDYYQQALPLRRAVGDRAGEAVTLNNIGRVYDDLGEKQKALDYFQQALPLWRAVGDRSGEAVTLNNIGGVYSALGEKQKALDYYQQALPLLRAVGNRAGEAVTLNNIGGVYSALGEKQKALDYYQQALPLLRAVGAAEGTQSARSGEAVTLNNIGGVYNDLGEKQKALDYYQQALPLLRAVGDRAVEAVTLHNIGSLLAKQNQPQLGIIFYKQSVNVYETLRSDIKGLPKELQQTYTETVAGTYRRLADLLLQQDRILEAQRVLDLLKVQELDDYLRGVRGNTNTEQGVPKLPPEQKIDEGIEAIVNKAVEIGQEISRLQERQKLNGKLTPSEEQRLAQLWKQQEQIVAEFNKFIESPEVLALINQLKPQTRSADLLNNLDNLIGLSDNLKKLQQNAVLIYPIIFDDRLEIILTTADSPPVRHTVKVSKKELNETIRAFREALQNPNLDAKKPAQQLYEWLIKPLENNLKTADAKTIIYAPDGQLRYIPLAALYDGKQWLIERYRVNNITAASLTDFNTKPEPKMHILAAAFVKGSYQFRHEGQDFKFNGLPFAGIEVDKLAQTVSPTTKYFDKDFNQTIIPLLDSYTVVHFATHAAFVVGTPEQSFVLFGDGTVVTLQTMKNWRFKNIDLIVLSACETGLGGNYGTGIEILGLGYRLQTAGARAVIASLWSVDDGGTQALMNAFYAALRTGKLSKAAALQQAQIALITSNNPTNEQRRGSIRIEPIEGVPSDVANRLSHPRYWAPFILIGNGL